MLWRKMFDTPAYSELFETQQETKHPWSLGMTEDSVSQENFERRDDIS
jgi:hypothetical protein